MLQFYKHLVIVIFLFLLLLTSCTRQEEKPVDYFPLKHGAVFEYNNGLSRREVQFYDHKNQYDLYEVKIFSNDSIYIMKDQFIRSDYDILWYGFKSADFGKIYFEPPINMIPLVTSKDTMFSIPVKEIHDSSTDNKIYNLRITYHILGKEELTVPAGTFNALHYRYIIRYIGDRPEEALMDFSGDWWFAKGVGLIKQSAAESTLELTSFDIP